APVVMSFDLCATQEVVLPDNACPSVDDLIKQVTLLDYYSGESIVPLANSSTPVSTGWGFGSNPNAWDKGSVGASATVAILDVNQSSIVNGRATLYFYIQCGGNPLPSPLTLGAMIKPT